MGGASGLLACRPVRAYGLRIAMRGAGVIGGIRGTSVFVVA